MDFDIAVNKLSRNHSKQVRRNRGKNTIGIRGGSNSNRFLSEKAKRDAEHNKRKAEENRRVEKIKKEKLRHIYSYFSQCERDLGTVKNISDSTTDNRFKAVSIHGDGDKITLPVSVLKTLMDLKDAGNFGNGVSPFEFRVGILNPDYKFPSSPKLIEMMEKVHVSSRDDGGFSDDDDDEDENKTETCKTVPFLEELSHKYLSYTHCTVVEFTQEEGHVGIPRSVASVLLTENSTRKISVRRTVDPATDLLSEEKLEMESDDEITGTSEGTSFNNTEPKNEEKTPGHLAWGEFDVPNNEIEVTMVKLPKGRGCTLTPTRESVAHGFHNLKDVKAVLEQSLIRTRATLSVNDTVHCWHRGIKFELKVSSVSPGDFSAVSCINTDIEVDIGNPDEYSSVESGASSKIVPGSENSQPSSVTTAGRKIGSSAYKKVVSTQLSSSQLQNNTDSEFSMLIRSKLVPEEPPQGQKLGVITAQIRGDGKVGQRRFDISTCALSDLFAFAAEVCWDIESQQIPPFRLVTRFPRRVFELSSSASISLKEAGIEGGREMFMMELI